jgi:phage tail-like protein
MHATNANNAKWFMLREPADFEPRTTNGAPDPSGPAFEGDGLFFDDARHVLELAPTTPPIDQLPLPGWASMGAGEDYLVDPRDMRLLVRRCDGREEPLLCDPNLVRCPAGLALDRRGFLYIADPSQRSVLVIEPSTGHIEARLTASHLLEPVDIAVNASGHVFIADRAGALIHVFSSRFQLLASWTPKNADNQPAAPRPISVMIDDDGNILVADARHPRLLRFTAAGEPLGDTELATSAAPAHPACDCRPAVAPCPSQGCQQDLPRTLFDDAIARHREYRLSRLTLGRSFAPEGAWVSAVLDSGGHDTTWHKLEFDAVVPAGGAITFQTATSNTFADIATTPIWTPTEIAFDNTVGDVLVHSPPGRFFRLRLRLTSDSQANAQPNAQATPSIRSIRVLFPRHSYLDSLPRIYRTASGQGGFLEKYLALFEHTLTRLEDRYDEFSRQLDPQAAPDGTVDWLASLLDLAFDQEWPLTRRRALLLRINDLYRIKGTPRGIVEYIRAYTGLESLVTEDFLNRPGQPAYVGRRGFVLGTTSLLSTASSDAPPDAALFRAFAHQFSVRLYLKGPDCSGRLLGVVERIVSANKPAHTVHRVIPVYPAARLDTGARIGIDMVLSGKTMPSATLGDCADPDTPGSTLGADMVLGDLNPSLPRPRLQRL